MKYCDNCGEKIKDGAVFCSSCGSKIVAPDIKSNSTNQQIGTNKSDVINSVSDISMNIGTTIRKLLEKFLSWYMSCINDLKKGEFKNKQCLIWIISHLIIVVLIIIALVPSKKRDSLDTHKSKVEMTENDLSDSDESKSNVIEDSVEKAESILQEAKDNVDYGVKVLFSSLQGKWSDENGYFTLIINDDGTVKISDASGVISADVFTYSEVDDDTVALKVKSDKMFAQLVSFNMDYHVDGKTLTISIPAMNISYDMQRVK